MTKRGIKEKNKIASIILAIIFGAGTWIYTIEKDWWKLLLSFAILNIGIFFGEMPNIAIGYSLLCLTAPWMVFFSYSVPIIMLFSWIWALVDVFVKPKKWYKDYYKKKL